MDRSEMSVEIHEMISTFEERRQGLIEQLEDLRGATRLIEKQARRLEREIERDDTIIQRFQTGGFRVEYAASPPRDRFVNMSIPDAAGDAIDILRRPLHVRELLVILEAGG